MLIKLTLNKLNAQKSSIFAITSSHPDGEISCDMPDNLISKTAFAHSQKFE